MLTLTFEQIEEIQKKEAIAFANWLSFLKADRLNKSIEVLYQEFKEEIQ